MYQNAKVLLGPLYVSSSDLLRPNVVHGAVGISTLSVVCVAQYCMYVCISVYWSGGVVG